MDHSKSAAEVFNKRAKLYQDKFMNVDLYKDTLDLFCGHIKKQNPRILEIACGPGNITQYLLEQRPDFKILGTDLAPNMLKLATINNPRAEFQLMDARDISGIRTQYDGIMCGFCLPYLTKAEAIKLIEDATGLLNENGLLYISTMEDDYGKSGIQKSSKGDDIYMHYHEASYLTAALTENNFSILALKRQEYPAENESKTVDLIILAQQ